MREKKEQEATLQHLQPFSPRQHFHFLQILLCAAPERANYSRFSNPACMERLLLQGEGTEVLFQGTGEHRGEDALREKG